MIEIIFENVESCVVPKEFCIFTIKNNKVSYLEFPLDKISYQSYVEVQRDRVLQYNNIVYIEINTQRFYTEWNDVYLGGEENSLQHSELLENGNVRIWWDGVKNEI